MKVPQNRHPCCSLQPDRGTGLRRQSALGVPFAARWSALLHSTESESNVQVGGSARASARAARREKRGCSTPFTAPRSNVSVSSEKQLVQPPIIPINHGAWSAWLDIVLPGKQVSHNTRVLVRKISNEPQASIGIFSKLFAELSLLKWCRHR